MKIREMIDSYIKFNKNNAETPERGESALGLHDPLKTGQRGFWWGFQSDQQVR